MVLLIVTVAAELLAGSLGTTEYVAGLAASVILILIGPLILTRQRAEATDVLVNAAMENQKISLAYRAKPSDSSR